MFKKELRKIYKAKRKELSPNQKLEMEQDIYNQIFELDFSEIQVVHLFLTIRKYDEINTQPIIDFLNKNNKTIVVSKCDFDNNTLQHFILDKNTKLEVNSWGIPEPVNAKVIHPKEIDLVFVPMLISDENNYRVGYGKGFYDGFLAECKPTVKTIGINFFKPVSKINDIHKFDVDLNQIIYPKK
ncbi:5-formyltetrahydrofolate cyclo-ligase [Polaribacter aestuariivivens]|uniref:5-formyltetrahydrofolate cyclo-ligase n=1 Tax=Polaribacter aestuariivivens TaxID=2304626 RepID=UPI003F498417